MDDEREPGAPDVAVVAHSRKSFGGGLPELRKILAREGVTDPRWHEVKKSRRAPEYARRAAEQGVDILFIWGGDGTVQRYGDDTVVVLFDEHGYRTLGLEIVHERGLLRDV